MVSPKPRVRAEVVSGNQKGHSFASSSFGGPGAVKNPKPNQTRNVIAQPWQIEAYRHVNICGEARYAATLFAAVASRAEIGISEPNALRNKAKWVNSGPEVQALEVLAPTVRDRTKLVRDFMLHWVIAGECYLIARPRQTTDPTALAGMEDDPIWEIVAVTEMRRIGEQWSVRFDNDEFIDLDIEKHPVVRMWNEDPQDRREAWSPFRSLLPTLNEIEWYTKHIYAQVKSRLMSAGVWFLPNGITFPPPPTDAIEGGEDTIAQMNDAQRFMATLAAASMEMLDAEEVSFPTIVMADEAALEAVDQKRLIQFWSEIDDKVMLLRSDSVRRFALGMDLPPEQILGSSGLAVSGSSGSAGSVNHWGVWANEEQTISTHVEPALDRFVSILTVAYLRPAVPKTDKVVAFDSASMRMRQDRSKESIELYNLGLLNGETTLRENGFDPQNDMMSDKEFRKWLLKRIAGGSASPDQVNESLRLLGIVLNVPASGSSARSDAAPGISDRNGPPSLKDHPYQGPPREQHDHSPAPFSASDAAAEVLVLRALEKAGNRLLNEGKRGKDRDRSTPAHLAHVATPVENVPEFDFSLAASVFGDLPAAAQAEKERQMRELCAELYRTGSPYARETLIEKFGA